MNGMEKKILCVLLTIAIALSACGCSSAKGGSSETVVAETEALDHIAETEEPIENDEQTLDLHSDLSRYVTLGDYKGLRFMKTVPTEVTDEEVKSTAEMAFVGDVPVTEGPLKEGDCVNINFTGYVDGIKNEKYSLTDYTLVVGSGSVEIPGFEDSIIGKKIGQTFDIYATFPMEYFDEQCRGKELRISIKVNSATRQGFVEPTEEMILIASGGMCETMDEYLVFTRRVSEAYEKDKARLIDITKMEDMIVENATFSALPEGEIDYYNHYKLEEIRDTAEKYGLTVEKVLEDLGTSLEDFPEYNREFAERYVKKLLVMMAIAQKEGKGMTDDELAQHMMNRAKSEGREVSIEEMMAQIAQGENIERLRTGYILEDLTQWLFDQQNPYDPAEITISREPLSDIQ